MGFLFHLVLFGVGCFCLFILTIDFVFCGVFLFLDREKKHKIVGLQKVGKSWEEQGQGKDLIKLYEKLN